MIENDIATIVIGKAIEVHKKLGPGLLESAYAHCLAYELGQVFSTKTRGANAYCL